MEVYPSFPKQLTSFVSQATSPLTEFSQHQRFFSSLQSVFHELSFAKQLKGTWAKKLSNGICCTRCFCIEKKRFDETCSRSIDWNSENNQITIFLAIQSLNRGRIVNWTKDSERALVVRSFFVPKTRCHPRNCHIPTTSRSGFAKTTCTIVALHIELHRQKQITGLPHQHPQSNTVPVTLESQNFKSKQIEIQLLKSQRFGKNPLCFGSLSTRSWQSSAGKGPWTADRQPLLEWPGRMQLEWAGKTQFPHSECRELAARNWPSYTGNRQDLYGSTPLDLQLHKRSQLLNSFNIILFAYNHAVKNN